MYYRAYIDLYLHVYIYVLKILPFLLKYIYLAMICVWLLEWLKWKRLTIPSVVKNVEKLELMYFVDRSVNYCKHFEKLLCCIF